MLPLFPGPLFAGLLFAGGLFDPPAAVSAGGICSVTTYGPTVDAVITICPAMNAIITVGVCDD